AHAFPTASGDRQQFDGLGVGEVVGGSEPSRNLAEIGGDQTYRGTVTDDHHVAGTTVEVVRAQRDEHRKVAVEHVEAGFAAGDPGPQIAVVPFLEHLHEEAVRFFVAAVLEFTDLHLVDALPYHRLERD